MNNVESEKVGLNAGDIRAKATGLLSDIQGGARKSRPRADCRPTW